MSRLKNSAFYEDPKYANNSDIYYADDDYGIVNETSLEIRRELLRRKRITIAVISSVLSIIAILAIVFAIVTSNEKYVADEDATSSLVDQNGVAVKQPMGDVNDIHNGEYVLPVVDIEAYDKAVALATATRRDESKSSFVDLYGQGIAIRAVIDDFLIGYNAEVVAPTGSKYAKYSDAEGLAKSDAAAKQIIAVQEGYVFGLKTGIAQLNVYTQDGQYQIGSYVFRVGNLVKVSFVPVAGLEDDKVETQTIQVLEGCNLSYMQSVYAAGKATAFDLPKISQAKADQIHAGYSFNGIWSDKDGNEFTKNTVVTQDTVLYANWTAIDFTLKNTAFDFEYGAIDGKLVADACIDGLEYTDTESKYVGKFVFNTYLKAGEIDGNMKYTSDVIAISGSGKISEKAYKKANVGEYTITVTVRNTDNNISHDYDIAIKVNSRGLSLIVVMDDVVYNGKAVANPEVDYKSQVVSGDTLSFIYTYYKEGKKVSGGAKAEGTYKLVVTLAENTTDATGNYYLKDELSCTFSINKKAVNVSWKDESGNPITNNESYYLYNGKERFVVAYIAQDELCAGDNKEYIVREVTYCLDNNNEQDVSNSQNDKGETIDNVGKYIATVSASYNLGYYDEDGKFIIDENYVLAEPEYSVEFTIKKTDITVNMKGDKVDEIIGLVGEVAMDMDILTRHINGDVLDAAETEKLEVILNNYNIIYYLG